MQRATRLIQPLGRAIRSTPRNPLLSIPRAGPSTLPRRYLSTTSSLSHLSQVSPSSASTTVPPFSIRRSENSESVAEIIGEEDELEESARIELDRSLKFNAPTIHAAVKPGQPIILPLSNLAESPAGISSSGLAITLPPEIWGERMRRDILHRCVVWYRASMREGTHRTKGRGEVAYSGRKLRPQKGSGRARLGDASSPHLRGGADAHPKRPRDYSFPLNRKIRALGMRIALSSKLSMGLLRVVQDFNAAGWQKTREASTALRTGWSWRLNPDYVQPEVQPEEVEAVGESSNSAQAVDKVESESQAQAEVVETETELEEYIRYKRYGFASSSKQELSVLFLHAPTKPATAIWDFARPLRNIPGVEIMSTDEVEVYHILKYRWLVMEGDAVDAITKYKGQVDVDSDRLEAVTADLEDLEVTEDVNAEQLDQQPTPVEYVTGGSESAESTVPEVAPVYTLQERRQMGLPRLPANWILEKWRKVRGTKSMRRTFGTKNATAAQLLAKRAHNKVRKLGRNPTPDLVAQYITKRKSTIAVPL